MNRLSLTNQLYNEHKFNSVKRIGSLSNIISQKEFNNVEEFIDYYFQTGINRRNDYSCGRTKEEIDILIDEYCKVVNSVDNNFSLKECKEQIYQRMFYDTWAGFNQEMQIINNLGTKFDKFDFRKTNSTTDTTYAIDIEIYKNNTLICGLQIKPVTYKYNKKYNTSSKKINTEKNNNYIKKYNVPVFYLYYKNDNIEKNSDYSILENLLSYNLKAMYKPLKKHYGEDFNKATPELLFKYGIIFTTKHKEGYVLEDYDKEKINEFKKKYKLPIYKITQLERNLNISLI